MVESMENPAGKLFSYRHRYAHRLSFTPHGNVCYWIFFHETYEEVLVRHSEAFEVKTYRSSKWRERFKQDRNDFHEICIPEQLTNGEFQRGPKQIIRRWLVNLLNK